MQHVEKTYRVELTAGGGGADVLRFVAPPIGVPFRDLSVVVSTGGGVLAFGVDWEVFYGGRWTGLPYESLLVNGLSKASGVVPGALESATVLWSDTSFFPTNLTVELKGRAGLAENFGKGGFPISVEFDNTKSVTPASFWVTFLYRTVSVGG